MPYNHIRVQVALSFEVSVVQYVAILWCSHWSLYLVYRQCITVRKNSRSIFRIVQGRSREHCCRWFTTTNPRVQPTYLQIIIGRERSGNPTAQSWFTCLLYLSASSFNPSNGRFRLYTFSSLSRRIIERVFRSRFEIGLTAVIDEVWVVWRG